jgi:hypothetical protein
MTSYCLQRPLRFTFYALHFSFLIGLLFCTTQGATAAPKVTFHFDEWVNVAIEKLETDGVTGGFHRHTRPWTRWEVAEAVRQAEARIADGRVKPTAIHLQLLEKLKREFAEELDILSGVEAKGRFRARAAPQLRSQRERANISPAFEGAFHYRFGRQLTLYQGFEIGNFPEKYPVAGKTASQRLNPWREDYTADFKRVFVRFPLSKFEVLVGREQLFWGTGSRGSVGISDNSPPFDLILLTGRFGKIKATAFTAQLDPMWHDEGPRRYLANRYLAGHRLDYQVNDRVEVGISEILLYGGEARGLDWKYFNPILPYYASQFNAGADDNVMFLLEAAVRPLDGLRLYGEWLLDDFQYVTGTDPNAVAWLAGVEWNGLLSNLDALSHRLNLRTEYTRVNRWAYTHLVQENQFIHFGSIIGHRVGTDADTFHFESGYFVNADARVTLFYEFERQGEAGVADRFRGEDFQAIPFPSGVVERRDSVGFRFNYAPLRAWQLDLAYQHAFIRNRAHRKGVDKQNDQLEFRLRYLWDVGL